MSRDGRYGLRFYALVAGFGFLSLAAFVQGVLPMLEPQSRTDKVTAVVRTDLGELKWMEYRASAYSPLEQRGRAVYIREGCWYCHSQYVRPVTGETRRWGPVTQAGEYAHDLPHLFSTRRIGPDLSRVGLKYSDAWHLAHFWNPRMLSPDSIMPRFTALFEGPLRASIVTDSQGRRTVERSPATERLFDFDGGRELVLTPNAEGLLYVPERGRYPVISTPNDEYAGYTVDLLAASADLTALVAYLQKLGTNRGKWRDRFEPQLMEAAQVGIPRSEEWIAHGQTVYQRRCQGCHGEKGDGNGPAAAFMQTDRPRDFTLGVFKFRLTPSGSLPDDGDLLRTITRGVRGTAMPSWHELPLKDRLAVIQYIKYELAADRSDPVRPYLYFVEEPPGAPLFIGMPPPPSVQQVARGHEVWQQAKCWECHGDGGLGDGEKAEGLTDDFGFPIPPANLTTGQFKSGPDVKDIFRTITTGLSGTPMPSFGDTVGEAERWALAYYVLSLSAFKDPLTGQPLQISAADRAALNDPGLQAAESRLAYRLQGEAETARYAGEAWAVKHGFDFNALRDARAGGAPAR
ncbi:cbb3-type cytochrome c oxidase subunit II [Pseudothauera rhizosphaerae]|uniref:C-type cytochrome n=1 Tax=Pseudothauera rhizosphaerae TaxID=2565932 RepID=A0A4S4AC62_9RHOO|nr:cbb3-type cytochrome c oxidase subunit II [Pseudothauera rhizosphaerae]THF56251.1 c-type cytochrome [Pseudothauera rhizosphaerae]